MAYDPHLADRVRRCLVQRNGITEKKMFGGLAFLHHGRMFCGILRDDLVVRVGPERYPKALARTHARPMDFTGRPLKGYVFVSSKGIKTKGALVKWVGDAIDFVSSLSKK